MVSLARDNVAFGAHSRQIFLLFLQLFLLNAARVCEAVWIRARVYSGRVHECSPLVVAVRHTAANAAKQKIGTIGEVKVFLWGDADVETAPSC